MLLVILLTGVYAWIFIINNTVYYNSMPPENTCPDGRIFEKISDCYDDSLKESPSKNYVEIERKDLEEVIDNPEYSFVCPDGVFVTKASKC